jgi:DNA-binding transcriptional MerR regulator
MEPEYLLIDEAAKLCRCPVATLYAWRSRNQGPPARRVGRRLLYRRDELVAWIDGQVA